MKKLSLSKQLFLIYTIVLFFTTLTFYSVLSGWLIEIYSDINYTKLDDFSHNIETIISGEFEFDKLIYSSKIEFSVIDVETTDAIYTSENLYKLIDENYFSSIYEKVVIHLEDNDVYRSELDTITDYFYSIRKTEDGKHYIFTVSSGILISQMQNRTAYQIMILFFLILLAGGLIIGFWSTILVKRVTSIADHVKTMPNNNYETSYLDGGEDEIGNLSISIDEMRKEIYTNEETKKEILQNLSHDIKTPLAVIKSYAEAILDNIESPEASLIIIKQSDLLQHKVEKLLELNRLNYLENDKTFEPINIASLVNRVVQNTKYLTNIEFELSLDNSVFYGYEENFQTIIENVISNAIRFAETKIVITLKNKELIFYNDGKHIEDKFLDSQFKAYEKGSQGIFGVGMSIVKKTTDFFKLELKVVNEEKGVSFIIKEKEKLD